MVEVKYNELERIEGGFTFSGNLINSLVSGIKVFIDLGRSLGTAIRRGSSGKLCPIA